MKRIRNICSLTALLFLMPTIAAFAQDTTWVQTYTYDSLWTRRAKFYFPTANEQYRKILMYYKIKCYASVSGDGNYPCGEWDGMPSNTVYDHRGVLDSTMKKSRYFTVNGNGGIDTLRYTLQQQYDIYRAYLYNTVVDNISSSNTFTLGSATTAMPHPFNLAAGKERSQFIWKASELGAAGLTAGNITGIQLNFQGSTALLNNVMIRLKQVPTDSYDVTAMVVDTLTKVYHYNRLITASGWNNFQFNSPFNWDGISNILVDFSFENYGVGTPNHLMGSATSYPSGLYSITGNYSLNTFQNTGGNVRFSQALNMFAGTAPRTYEMWVSVDSFPAPEGTLFSAGLRWKNHGDFTFRTTTPDNSYMLNLMSNDAAFSGPVLKHVWKHLAVTYANDTFRFYINGALVYLKHRPGLNTLTAGDFFLGESREGGYNYLGKFSHLRIWDKALSQADIRAWIGKDVTAAHPEYSHLKADYRLNTGTGMYVQDVSAMSQPSGQISGNLWWQTVRAKDIYYNAQKLNWRPQIRFERNVYTSHIDSVEVSDTVYNQPATLIIYGHPDGNHIIQDNDPNHPSLVTDVRSVWAHKYAYIYKNGVKIDSFTNVTDSIIYNRNLVWYSNTVAYEIGRIITPYGIGLNLGAGRTRVYDLTDYYPILQDTVDLEIGNDWELQDVKFAFVKGAPAAEVNRILQPWGKGRDGYTYTNIAADVALPPMTLSLMPNTDQVKFRSYVTGHGAEGSGPQVPNGCCEFMYNDHFYKSNGQVIHSFRIQRGDCGLNPIYPQGGTWVYDREGWCPGDIIRPHDFNVTPYISGGQVSLDYQIAPIPAGNTVGNGGYVVGLQVIEYKAPGRNSDAEIYDIQKPSDAFALSRINPICHTPQVIIRNSGKQPLTAAEIRYKVSGGAEESYSWTGNLKFLDTALVSLPISGLGFWNGDQTNRFIARIASANGVADEYAGNDTAYASYNIPDIMPNNRVIIRFRTNNYPQENTLTVRDANSTIMLQKTGLAANTQYRDTLDLPWGCYTMTLDDAGNDGLKWWANPGQGQGNLAILNGANSTVIKTFEPDFGAQVFYAFTVKWGLSVPQTALDNNVDVYPNPNNGSFYIQMQGFNGGVDLTLSNVTGQTLWSDQMECMGGMVKKNVDTKLPAGVYFLHVSSGDAKVVKKMVIQ